MKLLSKFNKGIRVLLCVTDIFSKYAWVILLKYKGGIKITNAFEKFLDESNCKPKKIWVDKVSGFNNRSMKSWIDKNEIEMYLTHNEVKFVVAERFTRTLNNKIYKNMTSVSENIYIDKLWYS